jgi:hypothetical protein
MITNPTIVTALFDIGRDKWDNYEISYNTYMMWMKNILYFDTNMVIYMEEKFKNFIIEQRKVVDPNLEKTIIKIDVLENLNSYKLFYHETKTLMESDEFKSRLHFNVPEMTKPLYNIIIFNKLYFIKKSIDDKDFNSDMFIWCDAGVLRDFDAKIKKGFPNVEKINNGFSDKITFFSHQENFTIDDKPFHLVSQFRYIHGGCILVPNNEKINKLIFVFNNFIRENLKKGYVGSEEKYLDFCYLENKDKYNIIKSDWRQYFDIFG